MTCFKILLDGEAAFPYVDWKGTYRYRHFTILEIGVTICKIVGTQNTILSEVSSYTQQGLQQVHLEQAGTLKEAGHFTAYGSSARGG